MTDTCAKLGQHDWRFDMDNPWLICQGCGEIRDAITGQVMLDGRDS